MHDDLGANLTGIALHADLALRELDAPRALAPRLAEIAGAARGMVDQMREVIWAANPKCDTLESLINYLCHFAQAHCGAAGLRCRLDFPENVQCLPLRTEVRHALFLTFKEALHNIVKHAAATEVSARLRVSDGWLHLDIRDNGVGADPRQLMETAGGVANMRARIEAVAGEFAWNARPGLGVVISAAARIEES